MAARKTTAVERRTGEGPSCGSVGGGEGNRSGAPDSNPALGPPAGASPSALKQFVDERYDRTGRLDTGAVPGALLPKLVWGGRRGEQTASRSEAFSAVHRVPAEAWESNEVDFRPLVSKHQPTRAHAPRHPRSRRRVRADA